MFAHLHTATILGQGGGGLIQTGMNLTGQIQLLIKSVIVVAIIVGILVTGFRTKWAAGAMATSILVGGAVIWGVANINVVSDRVGKDLGSMPAITQTAPAPTSTLL
jgi:high-affinity Fe2+/Pb2+ permease